MTVKLSYEAIHWGDAPSFTAHEQVWNYSESSARSLGRVDAISYATSKESSKRVWRHEFERKPRLLVFDDDGEAFGCARETPAELLGIGVVVDFEIGDRVVLVSGCTVATDADGTSIWLVTPERTRVALEQLSSGPVVTAHGIER